MVETDRSIKKNSWKSVRLQIKRISPSFANIIDELDPNDDYTLYTVKYPYGSVITDEGIFQIPNTKGELVPLIHSNLPNSVKNDLDYSGTIPLGLITENGIESLLQSKHRIIPGTFKGPGDFVSLWRVLEEDYYSYHLNWTITSGARSICMLPKVTDSVGHKALKNKYGLKLPVPPTLFDQWEIFSHLANHSQFPQPWFSEIVFFSKRWFKHRNDNKWNMFYRFLLDELCQSSSFRRNQFIFDSAFSIAQEKKNLKPNPYLADVVRHLIAIGNGSAPAFTPAINEQAAPIRGLQKIYLEDYGLKKYSPTIMHLHHFSHKDKRPAYYSFQMPTTSVFSPKSRKLSSVMAELQELKHIMEILLSEVLKGNIGLEKSPLYDLARKTRYSYYHSDKDKLGEVLPITAIENLDESFTKSIIDDNKYLFPEFGPFLRGCIQISSS